MDFARKQLEKYGWTDGKGLGKNETGMSEALKPKLKRSMTGVGHNAAADFTEHWWSTLYNKAASNIEVKEKNGTTKKIKTKDDSEFEITNSTWKLKRKKSKQVDEKPQEYEDFFVKTAVLGSGGIRTERIKESESESEDEKVQKDVFKMTDEELFAACEGRTAHKGARHGLKALGKLARIEQQEKLLLQQERFNGYSHAKKSTEKKEYEEEILEVASLNCDEDVPQKKKNKKKKKHCLKQENNDCKIDKVNNDINKSTKEEIENSDSNVSEIFNAGNTDNKDVVEESIPRKVKKKKLNTTHEKVNDGKVSKTGEVNEQCNDDSNAMKSKKRSHVDAVDDENCDTDVNMCKVKLSKKNKKNVD